MSSTNFDIAALVDDLQPVRISSIANNMFLAGAIMLGFLFVVIAAIGARPDLIAGAPDAMLLMRSGILALLGFGTAFSVLTMAKPAVGNQHGGWKTAIAAAAIFPLGGIIAAGTGDTAFATAPVSSIFDCMFYSAVGATATAIPMVIALRKGAPTSPERAGWLTGVASGGLGALAYNFHCPFDSLTYTGLWYSLAVAICAVAGRLIVPKLIRW